MASQLKELVNQMPDPDGRGLYSRIDKDVIDKAIALIHAGGARDITGIIDMLVEHGKGDDVKARYALHCLAVHAKKLGQPAQQQYVRALAAQLGGARPKNVQRYLIQEIPIAGGKCVIDVLGKLLTDEELCERAAQAVVAIGTGAAEQFRKALPKARGKCYLTVIQNLGVLRDKASVAPLRKAAGHANREVRLVAAWALANIGDADSADVVVKVAAAGVGSWERIEATRACMLLAERLIASGNKAAAVKIYKRLRDTRTDPLDKYVRDLAEKAIAAAG